MQDSFPCSSRVLQMLGKRPLPLNWPRTLTSPSSRFAVRTTWLDSPNPPSVSRSVKYVVLIPVLVVQKVNWFWGLSSSSMMLTALSWAVSWLTISNGWWTTVPSVLAIPTSFYKLYWCCSLSNHPKAANCLFCAQLAAGKPHNIDWFWCFL